MAKPLSQKESMNQFNLLAGLYEDKLLKIMSAKDFNDFQNNIVSNHTDLSWILENNHGTR